MANPHVDYRLHTRDDDIMDHICRIFENKRLKGEYFRARFEAPEICDKALPGQFAHVRIKGLRDKILRRPFSISEASNDGLLTIIYKVVGAGTEVLRELKKGDQCEIMGPLGNPYSPPKKDETPVVVAGGYGCAAVRMLCERSPSKGHVLLGARTSQDLLLADEFEKMGFKVGLATEDGSEGEKGRVTGLLEKVMDKEAGKNLKFYGCGPRGMLEAMAKMLLKKGRDGELSMDHLMCCGVGACFACVIKVRAGNEDGWRYARTCKEGPVFMASNLWLPKDEEDLK